MHFRRHVTTAAALLVGGVALAALNPPNPSLSDLSGPFRITLTNLLESTPGGPQGDVDAAVALLTKEHKSLSSALKSASKAVARTDRAFGDNAEYAQAADLLVAILNTTAAVQGGATAGASIADDVIRNPLPLARVAQKNAKVAGTMNADDPSSKISKASTRAKKLAVVSKAMKYFEKVIKKYGKNNPSIG